MKKVLSLILAVCLIAVCIPASVLSVSADAQIYENLAYVIDNGEAIIVDCNPEAEGTVTIPNLLSGRPVTTIYDGAFAECALITKVDIPSSVTNIGKMAFYGCVSLESVDLPNTVERIEEGTFAGCIMLSDINLSSGLKVIGAQAFSMCMSLETINIPNTLETIGEGAFMDCIGIKSVNIPESVTQISDLAFLMCFALESINVSQDNTEYSSDQYGVLYNKNKTVLIQYPMGKTLNSYAIPASVTEVYHFAFSFAQSLENIIFHDGIVYVGIYAFLGTAWHNAQPDGMVYVGKTAYGYKGECPETISIKDGTVSISGAAFAACSNLKNINMPDTVKVIGEMAFYLCESLENLVLPEGVERINDAAFLQCSALESIYIPSTVVYLGDEIFLGCNSLKSVNISPDNTKYASDKNGVIFNKDRDFLYYYPIGNTSTKYDIPSGVTDIVYGAFEGSESLYVIDVPESVQNIEGRAFANCTSLISTNIPENVETIKSGTFAGCNSLVRITLPENIALIEEGAFEGCDNLTDVWYTGSESDADDISILAGNDSLLNATWHFNACKNNAHSYGSDNICVNCGYDIKYYIASIFPDTANDAWYSAAITYAVESGIMKGYADSGLFGTADGIQRQDFLVMLARYDGVDLSAYADDHGTFADVAENSYFEAAVNWGYQNGIVNGYDDGRFGVGDMITREQIITFLYRYANYKGLETQVSSISKQNTQNKYYDFANVSDFSRDAVYWAIDRGVISGKENNTAIAPQGNAQRCEVAQIMYNIFKNDIF